MDYITTNKYQTADQSFYDYLKTDTLFGGY